MFYKTNGFSEDGRQKKQPLGYCETYELAFEALSNYNKNRYNIDLATITTVRMFELWFESMKNLIIAQKMSQHSLDLYQNAFLKHCKKLFKVKFCDLRTRDIQMIIDTVKLGYTSKRYIKGVFNYMYKYALENDAPISKNYAEFVKIIDNQESDKHTDISEEHLKLLWDNSSDYNVQSILILIYTGLRVNEFVKIEIKNSFLEQNYFIGGSKTEAGKNRMIPIHPKIIEFIKTRYNINKKYLFTKEDESSYTYDTFRTDFDKVMKRFNLNYTPHDCRYTFATQMKKAKADKNATKKILGHAIKDVTDGIYVQWSPELLLEELKKMD